MTLIYSEKFIKELTKILGSPETFKKLNKKKREAISRKIKKNFITEEFYKKYVEI